MTLTHMNMHYIECLEHKHVKYTYLTFLCSKHMIYEQDNFNTYVYIWKYSYDELS